MKHYSSNCVLLENCYHSIWVYVSRVEMELTYLFLLIMSFLLFFNLFRFLIFLMNFREILLLQLFNFVYLLLNFLYEISLFNLLVILVSLLLRLNILFYISKRDLLKKIFFFNFFHLNFLPFLKLQIVKYLKNNLSRFQNKNE